MKVLLDEHLPPALARSLDALFADEHEIVHLRDKFGPGVTDVEWIEALSTQGRWSVISGDRRITRSKVEAAAFRRSRLIGFFMSKGLYKAPVLKKMERLCALWPTIEKQEALITGSAMFELPMTSLQIQQLKA